MAAAPQFASWGIEYAGIEYGGQQSQAVAAFSPKSLWRLR